MPKGRADMENIRELVLDILLTLEREGGFEGKLIKAVLDKYNYLDQRDKAFIKRLAEGTIERQIELDYYIDSFSNIPVKKIKPLIRCLLRMGAYQIIYMDTVPDSAACNEACKLAQKRKFSSLKGFVNAVLRNISRNKENLTLPDRNEDTIKYYSVKYSMPQWIVEMWLASYGEEVLKRLLNGLLEIHPVSVRFDIRLSEEEIEGLTDKMRACGAVLKKSKYLPYMYTVENIESISELAGFDEGKFVVQDVSSALSVLASGIKSTDFVMDVCAAPGGKTFFAAQMACNVLSRDVSMDKVDIINGNIARLNAANVETECFDAAITDERYIERADVLIMDVPCSGLGVLGKKRDIKYHVSPESLESLNKLQREIVSHSWQYVKSGGTLVYSTCTINRKENEEMVRWILENLPFEPISVEERLPKELMQDVNESKSYIPSLLNITESDEINNTVEKCSIQLLPGFVEADGFFFAVFRRK